MAQGAIRAHRDGEEAWIARRGDAIAVLPLLDQKPTLVTATAIDDARVLFVEDQVFDDLMADNPALPLGIARFLAGEVRRLLVERRLGAARAGSREDRPREALAGAAEAIE